MRSYKDIDGYILAAPERTQALLREMRTAIRTAAPASAIEAISYGIPTFKLHGKNLVHFGAFRSHIGFFPTPSAVARFGKEFPGCKITKGAIQLPLDKPLPAALIRKIVSFRAKEIAD